MSRALSIVKKGDLKRALDAAKQAGLVIDCYRVLPDGEIFVKVKQAGEADSPQETPEKVLGLV